MRGYSVVQTVQNINSYAVLEATTNPNHTYYLAKAWASKHEIGPNFDQNIWIVTTSTPSTVSQASPVIDQLDPGDPASLATVGGVFLNPALVFTIVYAEAFNWANSWIYIPNPSERLFITGGLTVGLYMGNPPAQNLTIDCGMILVEVG